MIKESDHQEGKTYIHHKMVYTEVYINSAYDTYHIPLQSVSDQSDIFIFCTGCQYVEYLS